MTGMQQIVVARRPFGMDVEPLELPAGLTIAEMVARVPGMPEVDPLVYRGHLVVCCGDQDVPEALWAIARPRVGAIVTISLRMGDGGGILRTLALIAVAAAATIVSAGALAPLFGAAFAAGGIGAALAGAAVGLSGAFAVNALFRSPTRASAFSDGASGTVASSAAIAGNLLARGKPLPCVAGERRISPPLVVNPIRELVGDDMYAEAIFACAGTHRLRNPRLGSTVAEGNPDLEIETREGWSTDTPLTLVTRHGIEEQTGVVLSQHLFDPASATDLANQQDPFTCLPRWHRVTSRVAHDGKADEIWLMLSLPEGLFDDDAPDENRAIPVRFRFRAIGDDAWINAPEILLSNRRAQLFRKTVRFIWGAPPDPLPDWPDDGGPVAAFREVPQATVTGAATPGGWTAHAHFSADSGLTDVANISLEQDRVVFWLDEETFPKGRYEIEMMQGHQIVSATLNTATYGYASTIYDFFGFYLSSGTARLVDDLQGRHMQIEVPLVTSIRNELPVTGTDCALIAFRGRNRSFDSLSVEAAHYVADLDEATGEWTDVKVTLNPAPHYRDTLIGTLNKDGRVPASLVDDTVLTAWRADCASRGLEVSAVLEGTSGTRARQVIAAAGYGEPRQSDLWGVIWERDRSAETPVQAFTPRNSRNASFAKAFPIRRPDGLIITFRDRDADYAERQVVVYDDGVDPANPDILLEERSYEWAVTEDAAVGRAALDLRMERLRSVVYSRDVAWDARLVVRGDLVLIQDDVYDRQTGSGLVKEVLTEDGLVTGLILDALVPVTSEPLFNVLADVKSVADVRLTGLTSAASIRLDDGTIIDKAIVDATGDTDTITFETPFAMPTADFGAGAEPALTAGVLVMVGIMGSQHRRVLVTAIERKSEKTLAMKFIDEAQDIYA
jgi:hypothetical protein